MVRAYHVIFCAYGFWLPNDPRGSWSEFVRKWELLRFGSATKTTTRRSVAHVRHDATSQHEAKRSLQYPQVHFTGVQAREIGNAFADFATKSDLHVWACSILSEHIHMVIRRHRYKIEQVVNLLKGAATTQLLERQLHPLAAYRGDKRRPPPMWARGEWKVFLNDERDIRRAIRYVEENPIKEQKRRQRWSFVTSYEPVSV